MPRVVPPCPACGRPWFFHEIMGAARRGGGYMLSCGCGHVWDDPQASYGERSSLARGLANAGVSQAEARERWVVDQVVRGVRWANGVTD